MKKVKQILLEEALDSNLSPEQVLSYSRRQDILWTRYRIYWRARKETNASYPQIGRVLKRDHTTVIHGERCYQARLDGKEYRKPGRNIGYNNSDNRDSIGC